MKYFFYKKTLLVPKSCDGYPGSAPDVATTRKWSAKFRKGHKSTSISVHIEDENIKKIHKIALNDLKIRFGSKIISLKFQFTMSQINEKGDTIA